MVKLTSDLVLISTQIDQNILI